MTTPHDIARNPSALFQEQVSRDMRLAILRCLFQCYKDAHDNCSELPKPEAHDALPIWRRALVEANLRNIAPRFGATATAELNSTKNHSHTSIQAGRFILTESAVETPGQVVRKAEFRATYARYNQFSFFDDTSPPQEGAPIYCILLHGVSDDPRVPLFVQIKFPGPDCRGYIEGNTIDLFAEFQEETAVLRKATPMPKKAGKSEVA